MSTEGQIQVPMSRELAERAMAASTGAAQRQAEGEILSAIRAALDVGPQGSPLVERLREKAAIHRDKVPRSTTEATAQYNLGVANAYDVAADDLEAAQSLASSTTPAPVIEDSTPWRVGQKLRRTLYAQLGPEPDEDDPLLGLMESPMLAAQVVAVMNRRTPASSTTSGPRCGGSGEVRVNEGKYVLGPADVLDYPGCPDCSQPPPGTEAGREYRVNAHDGIYGPFPDRQAALHELGEHQADWDDNGGPRPPELESRRVGPWEEGAQLPPPPGTVGEGDEELKDQARIALDALERVAEVEGERDGEEDRRKIAEFERDSRLTKDEGDALRGALASSEQLVDRLEAGLSGSLTKEQCREKLLDQRIVEVAENRAFRGTWVAARTLLTAVADAAFGEEGSDGDH